MLTLHGVAKDGSSVETSRIQRAFDEAAEKGEPLLVPAGVYRTGTLRLRSGLHLVLGEGARLVGSEEISDYVLDETHSVCTLKHYLLWGKEVSDVTISGPGVLEGSGPAFWQKEYFCGKPFGDPEVKLGPETYNVLKPKDDRPVMIYCESCRNLTFEEFGMKDSPAYTLWLLGCENAVIRNLKVRNPLYGPNTDVLDIDCSRRVRISGCDFVAGDDCIALKSDCFRLGRMAACEDVVAENCRFKTATCGIRVGYEGDGPIRNCVFRDLDIRDTRHGIDMLSLVPGKLPFTEILRGTPIENIVFERITMTNTANPFWIWAGNVPGATGYDAGIRDILFRDIRAESLVGSFIGSSERIAVENLRFENVSIVQKKPPVADGVPELPSHWGANRLRAALEMLRVRNLAFRSCRISVPEGTTKWTGSEAGFSAEPEL